MTGEAVTRRTPDEVDLFLFSAATWLTHRIHFDRDHARREGFADLVVHGPLQAAYLAQWLAETSAPFGGRLAFLEFRHRETAYVGETLELRARLLDVAEGEVRVGLAVLRPGGEEATTGTAGLRFPDHAAVERWHQANC